MDNTYFYQQFDTHLIKNFNNERINNETISQFKRFYMYGFPLFQSMHDENSCLFLNFFRIQLEREIPKPTCQILTIEIWINKRPIAFVIIVQERLSICNI